jgi:hypothetical protein
MCGWVDGWMVDGWVRTGEESDARKEPEVGGGKANLGKQCEWRGLRFKWWRSQAGSARCGGSRACRSPRVAPVPAHLLDGSRHQVQHGDAQH